MGVRAALAAGLALLLAGVLLTLTGSPARVIHSNAVALDGEVAVLHGAQTACQPEASLPPGTTAVRLTLESVIGPHVLVTVSSGSRVLASGARGSGWTGADVTVPVHSTEASPLGTTLCVTLGEGRESVLMVGDASAPGTAATADGDPTVGRMRVEYLAPGVHSWLSQARAVARRLGLGRAPGGGLAAAAILGLMAMVTVLASRLSLRELAPGRTRAGAQAAIAGADDTTGRLARGVRALRRVPRAARVCALIACLNAAAWSILSPPFQVPDEPAHFAYVQQLAQAHRLPLEPRGEDASEAYSPEEETALTDLHHNEVQFMPSAPTISTPAEQQKLEHDLAQHLSRRGSGYAGTATNEPPLYYALETIPYELGSGVALLDQLELMRLFSALFAGATALFAFMFVRETLPGTPWAWTVGGLGVALAPLPAFISGGVNPDGMLFAVSAANFYLLARAFRRGLTPALAAAMCAAMLLGVLTKLNFLGLVPGLAAGLLVTVHSAPASVRRVVRRSATVALAVAASALALAAALGELSGDASGHYISSFVAKVGLTNNALSELSYTWQFYLPRLPGMASYFPGVFTTRQLWFNGLVGFYGWGDTAFPTWVYNAALIPAGLIGLLWLLAVLSRRDALHRRWAELAVYATMAAGLLTLVGITSYDGDVIGGGGAFWEPRYLVPLLPLFAAALALAARGAGRHLGPLAGVLIVVLVLGHDVFSQLLVVSRYYG